ncbi:LysR substrate-binding domain-containing protein [Trinickia caryophylli]|uniref:Transcriptional regulator, LysR family n=1 Tax=Trinickia caryophylli TaxID=28094 RepID=A0A1X7FUB8_TRICW|nr:LysR substrate-binding domain-containing protein [Trinickia caryophylli]PMS11861.1 LysR family transcriptional regulator [Trinickia caryophylli]TRX14063.1 LysR family transcriptional regulator [Trinickia caryophylli]WQE13881.1 LysR substrate-binding domain-containing protein [Trinickia caryophylli]SMF58926.1 transcriptional regulator, LysR family [Trinickia caryophylli]
MSEHDRLPPLQALSVFESAARLMSFTAAARELGSTQPAVSQRIVQLEVDLGAPLFERGHRGVTLTADGQRLYEAVRQSIAALRGAASEIRARRTKGALTILTDAGFATYWLVPRLMDLRRLLPDINVSVVTSQQTFDPRRDHADVAIAFGDGDWSPCTATRLFPEQVVAVCSAQFRAAHPHIAAPADLRAVPLLHVQPTEPERWLGWNGWFAAHGLSAPPDEQASTFNSYALVMHAALTHQGVALGWLPLVDELIATGQLVALFDEPVTTARGYFLVCPQARPEAPAAPAFRRWLFAACANDGVPAVSPT